MAVAKLNLSVENEHDLILISKALSSEIRIRILKTLEDHSMSVSEIAKILDEPISSTALNLKILENANLISSEIIYTKLGKTRVCRRTYDNIDISTLGAEVNANSEPRVVVRKIRIASYSDYHDITAPCGMVSATNFIARFDEPDIFFSPDRIRAADLVYERQPGMAHFQTIYRNAPERTKRIFRGMPGSTATPQRLQIGYNGVDKRHGNRNMGFPRRLRRTSRTAQSVVLAQ